MKERFSSLVRQSVGFSGPGCTDSLLHHSSTRELGLSDDHHFVLFVFNQHLLLLYETNLRSSVKVLDGSGVQRHVQFGVLLAFSIAVGFSNNAPDQTGIVIVDGGAFSNHGAI